MKWNELHELTTSPRALFHFGKALSQRRDAFLRGCQILGVSDGDVGSIDSRGEKRTNRLLRVLVRAVDAELALLRARVLDLAARALGVHLGDARGEDARLL